MTLEEAKKNIQERMDLLLKRYREWNDAHPEWFASGELIGQVEGLEEAMGILDEVDTEPVVKDKLTLTELAHELRKLFKFKYLAYGEIFAWGGCYLVLTIGVLPLKLRVRDEGGEGVPCYIHEWTSDGVTNGFLPEDLAVSIDLSEYADENGFIDYSKCIVEVPNDIK